MSQTTSIKKSDLDRFMYEGSTPNVHEITIFLDNHMIWEAKVTIEVNIGTKKRLLSKRVNQKLSKSNPNDVKRRRNAVMYVMAFFFLAVFAAGTLPQPLNWFLAGGCMVPPLVAVIKKAKDKIVKHGEPGKP